MIFLVAQICEALGDYNIWGSLNPTSMDKPQDEKSVMVIAARLDTATIFDDMSPGAESTVTGVVTLLAVLKHLADIRTKFMESSKVRIVINKPQ